MGPTPLGLAITSSTHESCAMYLPDVLSAASGAGTTRTQTCRNRIAVAEAAAEAAAEGRNSSAPLSQFHKEQSHHKGRATYAFGIWDITHTGSPAGDAPVNYLEHGNMTSNSGIADRTYNTNPAGLVCHG